MRSWPSGSPVSSFLVLRMVDVDNPVQVKFECKGDPVPVKFGAKGTDPQ